MAGGKIIPKMTWRQGEEGTKVKLNRIMLTYRCLSSTAGIPQGSILGPI